MIGTSHVIVLARWVRVSAVTFAVTMLVAFIAVSAFASHYNEIPSIRSVVAEPTKDTELAAAITEQVSRGLTCREAPALTDTILFQANSETAVQVLSFEQALAAASASEGWIRRYCV